MHSADRNAHLIKVVEGIHRTARRADRAAIDRLLAQPAGSGQLDEDTLDFLRHAQDLILNVSALLTTMIEPAHWSGEHCGRKPTSSEADPRDTVHHLEDVLTPTASQRLPTIDAAEAWRRANLRLTRHHEDPIFVHIREFEDGYQAIPITVIIPEPPPVPTIDTPTSLVIDKTTGTVTRWPLLPLDVLASQYRRYQRQEQMTFDDHTQ